MPRPPREILKVLDQDLHPALFLIFISTLGGAIRGNIQSCGIQKLIKGNALVSQLMLFTLIYVAVSKLKILQADSSVIKMSSLDTIGLTFTLFLVFTIVNKNHVVTLIIGMILLLLAFMLNNVITNELKQYKDGDSTEYKIKKVLITVKKTLQHIAIVLFILGFILYMIKQMKDRGSDFNFVKFLFGTGKCENL